MAQLNWLRRLFTRQAPPEAAMPYSNLHWPVGPAAPNQSWVNDAISRSRAESEVRNSALAKKIASAWSGACIAGSGVSPMFRDAGLRRRWDAWTRSCDAGGRLDWIGIQQQVVECLVTSGEVFVQMLISEDTDPPLQLLTLGPEFIDLSHDDARTTMQGIVFDGVRRTGYWLYRSHPGEPGTGFNDSVLIPASDVLHIFKPVRPGQQRGETWLASSLYLMRLLREYLESDLTRCKTQSLFAGFVVSDTGANPLMGQGGSLSMEPGSVVSLPSGASGVEFTSPSDHAGAFLPFVTTVLRQIASGAGIPYSVLANDLSSVTFAAGKHELLEWKRQVESIQYGLIVPQLCEPILQRWLQLAEALGYVDGDVPHPRWSAPVLEALDRRAEVQSTVLAIRAGLQSRREAVESLGWVAEDVDAEIAADQQRADAMGLVLDTDGRKRTQQGQATQPGSMVNEEELS